jgi:hypothetical protein
LSCLGHGWMEAVGLKPALVIPKRSAHIAQLRGFVGSQNGVLLLKNGSEFSHRVDPKPTLAGSKFRSAPVSRRCDLLSSSRQTDLTWMDEGCEPVLKTLSGANCHPWLPAKR